MENNVYAPPKAEIREAEPATEMPAEVLKKIRGAVIVGCISTVVTLAAVLISLTGVNFFGFSAWQFLDVALLAGLTFGIYKKSRTCAVIMLVYFIISKLLLIRMTGVGGGTVLSLVFLYYYAQGIAGTFQYHRLKSAAGE